MKIDRRQLLAVSVVAGLLLVIHFAKPTPGGLWLRTFYESLHVPFFGVIAVCLLCVTPQRWNLIKRLAVVTVTVIGLSVLSEAAQIPTSRDASLTDLVADWLGAAGFLALAVTFLYRHSAGKLRGWFLLLLGVLLIVWPLLPLAKVSVAYIERARMLPALVRFGSASGSTLFRLQDALLTRRHSDASDSVSADILLEDGPWPGIVFHDIWPNWEPYTALVIEIENPETAAINVNVRVDDREHGRGEQRYGDRFNRSLNLASGRHAVRIEMLDIGGAPDNREMNLTEISSLIIFASREESGRRFILHDIRLE